jgi:4-amino-4-deoxy-L-arabinose transferase-like glycosyltransferase
VNTWVIGFNYIPDPDAIGYENTAINVIRGQGFLAPEGRSYNPPLYPLFLAGVYSVFGLRNYLALKMIESLIGALTCGWVYLLGLTLFGRNAGRLAGFIAIFYPFLVYYTGVVLSENLFTFFLMAGSVCLAVLAQQGFRWRYALGGGILLGLATLTRPMTLALPAILVVWAMLTFPARQQRTWFTAVVVSLALILTVLPWSIRNYIIHHQVVPVSTRDGIAFWGSNNPVVADDPAKIGRWIMYTDLPHADEPGRRPPGAAVRQTRGRPNPSRRPPSGGACGARRWR